MLTGRVGLICQETSVGHASPSACELGAPPERLSPLTHDHFVYGQRLSRAYACVRGLGLASPTATTSASAAGAVGPTSPAERPAVVSVTSPCAATHAEKAGAATAAGGTADPGSGAASTPAADSGTGSSAHRRSARLTHSVEAQYPATHDAGQPLCQGVLLCPAATHPAVTCAH